MFSCFYLFVCFWFLTSEPVAQGQNKETENSMKNCSFRENRVTGQKERVNFSCRNVMKEIKLLAGGNTDIGKFKRVPAKGLKNKDTDKLVAQGI